MILDEAYCEFNTLDDPDASLDLLRATRTSSCCARSRKIYGLCGLRVGFALCGDEDFVTAVDQVRQPFFCNAAAQAAAIEALRHQDAVAERVERAVVARVEIEERPARAGHRARRVAGQLRLVRPPGRDDEEPPRSRPRRARAWPSAACSCARAARWAAPARCG